ncbi:unnamed protein product [Oikopleura dioica]|uniref:Uncharacterized protein n=1 Tax=Oikopleura dioica TaxID=34765 RepID=E4YMK7_OIKDI|nr:unnamed protein product [Oikopleura dioica]
MSTSCQSKGPEEYIVYLANAKVTKFAQTPSGDYLSLEKLDPNGRVAARDITGNVKNSPGPGEKEPFLKGSVFVRKHADQLEEWISTHDINPQADSIPKGQPFEQSKKFCNSKEKQAANGRASADENPIEKNFILSQSFGKNWECLKKSKMTSKNPCVVDIYIAPKTLHHDMFYVNSFVIRETKYKYGIFDALALKEGSRNFIELHCPYNFTCPGKAEAIILKPDIMVVTLQPPVSIKPWTILIRDNIQIDSKTDPTRDEDNYALRLSQYCGHRSGCPFTYFENSSGDLINGSEIDLPESGSVKEQNRCQRKKRNFRR